MFSTRSKFLGVTAVLAALVATQVMAATAKVTNVLEWDTMVGVPTGLTGAQSKRRCAASPAVASPGRSTLPEGNLTTGGHLKIIVKGLVVAREPAATRPARSERGSVASTPTARSPAC